MPAKTVTETSETEQEISFCRSSTLAAASDGQQRQSRSQYAGVDTRSDTGMCSPTRAGSGDPGKSECPVLDWTRSGRRSRQPRQGGHHQGRTAVSRTSGRLLPIRQRQAGLFGRSQTEDLSLDPALDVLPGFEFDRTVLNCGDPTLDFLGPSGFSIWVGRTVEAAEKLGGNFGSSLEIEAQRIREDGLSGLGHGFDSTPIHDAQQGFAADAGTELLRRRR